MAPYGALLSYGGRTRHGNFSLRIAFLKLFHCISFLLTAQAWWGTLFEVILFYRGYFRYKTLPRQKHGATGEIFFQITMNTNHQQLLTQEGLKALKDELEELVKVKRPATVTRLADAREAGDLSENSEYVAAKQDLAFIDGRIAELEDIIRLAKVAGPTVSGQIGVGSRVTVHVNGKQDEFTLVGEWEADPMKKKISHESPLGKALLGKKVGDIAEFEAPVGKIKYKILEIG